MLENIIRILNKTLCREVKTLGLYWLTQPELRPVFFY